MSNFKSEKVPVAAFENEPELDENTLRHYALCEIKHFQTLINV